MENEGLQTTRDMYYITYKEMSAGNSDYFGCVPKAKLADNERDAISIVDSLVEEKCHDIIIINHRSDPIDTLAEGCPWKLVCETIDHDFVYYMYMDEFLRMQREREMLELEV